MGILANLASIVIRKGPRHDIVTTSINSSKLWISCKVLRLTKNMKLRHASSNKDATDIKQFAVWMLEIGDGQESSNELGESIIDIPQDLLITDTENPLLSLVHETYP